MATRITATELARNLSDILNRVRYRGESFQVMRNGEEIAVLEPPRTTKRITVREFAQLWSNLPKPDHQYWADTEESIRDMRSQPVPPSPWDA